MYCEFDIFSLYRGAEQWNSTVVISTWLLKGGDRIQLNATRREPSVYRDISQTAHAFVHHLRYC